MHTARSKKQQLAFLYLVVQKWKSSSFSKRKHSWQAYLERISPFLLACKGIWWWEAQDGSRYIFFDGKDKPDYQCEGPQLLHFGNATIKDAIRRQNEAWQAIIEAEIQIPAECIQNKEGQLITQASTTTPVIELSLGNGATNSGDNEKANQIVSHTTILVTGDHETEVMRPFVHDDVTNIEHQTVATEPGSHHDAPDTMQ